MAESRPAASLAGRLAVVTGASRGIGRETAIRLARENMRLVLVARTESELAQVAALLGSDAIVVAADLADPQEVARLAGFVVERVGAPDVLINNAGAFFVGPIEQLSIAEFQSSLAVNMLAPFMLVRAFLPAMRTRNLGHIVTVGSVADRVIFPENAAYASTKFGLRAMHEVIRSETRGSGVRATLVSPGPVDTRLWDPIDPDNREGFTPREEMLDPQSVADAIVYAISRPQHVDIEELRISRS